MANDHPSHVAQVAAILRSGARPVAAFVFWTLAGVSIDRARFRARMEAIGLSKAVGRDPRPEALLSQAVVDSSRGLGRSGGLLFRRLGRYAHAIVEQVHIPAGGLRLTHTLTIRLVDGVATIEEVGLESSTKARELAARVLERFEYVRDHVESGELSNAITTAMHGTLTDPMLASVSLRERAGGLYLCPAQSVEKSRMLATVVREETSSTFHVLALYADEENLKAACDVARQSLAGRLNELRDEVAEFAAEMKAQDKETGDRNLSARLKRYDALRGRVEIYSDLLGSAKEDLLGGIEKAKGELAAQLGV